MLQCRLEEMWSCPLFGIERGGIELGEGQRQHLAQWASTTQELHSLILLLAP